MNHAYFNRIVHLLEHHPQQGKRLIGLGANAFWELWQRVEKHGLDGSTTTGRKRSTPTASRRRTKKVG